ncbi:hypothetical protein [Actinomadura rudentiformis]|uniref:hypothetical protein n=1 Tax=Actinomadura rudentiformis TaxID=359158 RepID=UPI001CEF6F63|nr:hypothetical protein [Actinomadura rudentiformis]
MPVVAGQRRQRRRLRRAQPLPPDQLTAQQAADLLIGHRRISDDRQDRVQQRLPILPGLGSLGQRAGILRSALLSRAETAWSNNCTTSSSTSVADCASSVNKIG